MVNREFCSHLSIDGRMGLIREVVRAARETALTARLVGFRGALKWLGAAVAAAPEVAQTRSLAAADRGLGDSFTIRCDGHRISLTEAEFGICREIFGHDCYGLRPLTAQLQKVIDLGSNCGAFTLMAACLNPNCQILAVDANPVFTAATLRNADKNGFRTRVRAATQLVGSAEVESIQDLIHANPSVGHFDPSKAVEELGGCDFLKCDVEGGEHALFSGDLAWLQRVRRLAIEYHWNREAGEQLAARLRANGFHVQIRPHGRLGYLLGWTGR